MPTKNVQAEEQATKQFMDRFGRAPENTQEQSLVAKYAYPSLNDLPEEMKANVDTSLWGAPSGNSASMNPMDMTLEQLTKQSIASAQGAVDSARTRRAEAGVGLGAASPSMLGGAFAGIQKAIRTRTAGDETPLGSSGLFDAAGLKGFATLSQSLNQNLKDINNRRVRLDNILTEIGSQFRDTYTTAKDAWTVAEAEYKDAAKRLDDSMAALIQHQRQIELIGIQNKAAKELAAYQHSLSSGGGKKGPDIRELDGKLFQIITDAEGNITRKEIKDVGAAEAVIDTSPGSPKNILTQLNDLKNDPNKKAATGLSGVAASLPIPTKASSFNQKLDRVKALLALPNLSLLKGPMSDKDLLFIQNTGSALNTRTMKPADFDKELDRVINTLDKGILLNEAAALGISAIEVEAALKEADGDINLVREALSSQ